MQLSVYNSLLDAIQRPTEWKRAAGLVGTSAAIREFANRVTEIRSRAEGDQEKASFVVIFRAPGCPRIDNGIRSLMGLSNVTPVVLKPTAPIYNEGLLFGVGPRKGVLESSGHAPVVVLGLEHLDKLSLERVGGHCGRWRDPRTLTVLFAGYHPEHEALISVHRDLAHASLFKLPPLTARREDVPWVLHDEASEFGGGLNDFGPDALDILTRHEWPGDLADVVAVVRRLYASQAPTSVRSFGVQDVKDALKSAGTAGSLELTATPLHLWGRIQNLIQECDRRAVAMMERPFFLAGTLPAQAAPLTSDSPELNMLRLVSWFYMTFIESAEPNGRIILRLAKGLRMNMDKLIQARGVAGALRTFEQHRLDAASPHDKSTMNLACEWYENACGRRQPESEDVERCILRLLLDIISGLEDIVAFLNAVVRDDFRSVLLHQWRDLADKQWPKHRFESIVSKVINDIGRMDLRADVVTEKLLSDLQSVLAATSDEVDKEAIIRSLIERRVLNEFPKEMPVNGKDILELGVLRGPQVAQVLAELKAIFASKNSSRESLLAEATIIIARVAK